MRVIGVTGGIGSGKSTVSSILKDHGAKIIDADKISHEITVKGEQAFDELINYFGSGILSESGELDRKKLADIAFASKEKLSQLNKIMHKHVVDRIDRYLYEFREKGAWIVVIDAPIPIENGFLDRVDETWVVTADRDRRIARVMERSRLTHDEVAKRIASQMTDIEYLQVANKVIANDGDLSILKNKVNELLQGDIH